MKTSLTMIAFSVAAMGSTEPSAAKNYPKVKAGWTHEEFLEYLSLNTTEGWAGMSKVTYYNVTTPGEHIDLGHHSQHSKRGWTEHRFSPWSERECGGHTLYTIENFGCGACITNPLIAEAPSAGLFRESTKSPYPTVDWFLSPNCWGPKIFHQGIGGSDHSSCCDYQDWKTQQFRSVILYYDCHH